MAEISGKALESCRLSVWCHGTKQWREGTVVGYDGSRIRHQIKFDDMTQLSLLLAACKVRWVGLLWITSRKISVFLCRASVGS